MAEISTPGDCVDSSVEVESEAARSQCSHLSGNSPGSSMIEVLKTRIAESARSGI